MNSAYRRSIAPMLFAALLLGATHAAANEAEVYPYDHVLTRLTALEDEMAQFEVVEEGGPDSPACRHECGGCGRCAACSNPCGWFAGYDAVFLTPHFEHNTAFEVKSKDSLDKVTVRQSTVDFDWDMKHSPRIYFGRINCGGFGWRVRYWQFDQGTTMTPNEQDFVDDGFFGDDPTIIFGLAADNAAIRFSPSDFETAIIRHSLELHTVDFEAICRYDTCYGTIGVAAGIRYAFMDQLVTYNAADTPDQWARLGHDFNGVGPVVALEGRRYLCRNVSLFAEARGAILLGESSLILQAFDADDEGDRTDMFFNDNDNDLISIVELQVGVEWSRCLERGGRLFVRTAFEGQAWLGAGSGFNAFDSQGFQTPQNGNMGLFGFSVGTGIDW